MGDCLKTSKRWWAFGSSTRNSRMCLVSVGKKRETEISNKINHYIIVWILQQSSVDSLFSWTIIDIILEGNFKAGVLVQHNFLMLDSKWKNVCEFDWTAMTFFGGFFLALSRGLFPSLARWLNFMTICLSSYLFR